MRELLTFPCEGVTLAGSLDRAHGATGLLVVTGGTQTRIGSHRLFERLGAAVAQAGHPCLRFDRRGVGDSQGHDMGFRGSEQDIVAAAQAFRRAVPGMRRMVGLGLCDGATALMLFAGSVGLDGLVLVNPWLVEAGSGAPPPAAIRRRYLELLADPAAWRRLLTGQISFRKAARGLRVAATPTSSRLGREALSGLNATSLPAALILSRGDATAIAAELVWRSGGGAPPLFVETDSHTFAGVGDVDALRASLFKALRALDRH